MLQTLSGCGPRSSSIQKGALCVLAHVMSRTLLLVGCLATTPVAAEILTAGVYHNPPKLFADDEGRPRGVQDDLLHAIATEEQWQLESLQCDFQHCLTLLEQGDIDLLPNVAWSEERVQRIAFHEEPVMHTWAQLYPREGAKVGAIFDREAQPVSVQKSYLEAVTERFDINVTWLPVSRFSKGFQAVVDDEADIVAANQLFGDWRIPAWVWWGMSLLILLLIVALLGSVLLKRRMQLMREKLNTHEVLLATILDNVDAYVYIKSSSLKYRYVNRRMSELFNRPVEGIVGKCDDDFFNTESAKTIKKIDKNILDSGKKITIEEHNILQGEEHVRTFLSIKMPLITVPGEAPCLCGISTELTESLEMQSKTHSLAFYDALTGLPNRRRLMELLADVTDHNNCTKNVSAIFVVDLDSFRLLNDIQGHESGDQLLVKVAESLQKHLPQEAIVARFSSDEFVVLLNALDEQQGKAIHKAELLARQLLEAIAKLRNDRSLPITASIGISLFKYLGVSVNSVLQQADMALQQAKAAGGNSLRFFNMEMQTRVLERARLEGDLHQALEHNELSLHYQVQVNHQGVTTGVEALLRWYHPQRGWVSPATFIPLAEENGLILPIGHWVLRLACEQLAIWAQQPAYAALTISVNVSSVQFQQPGFVRDVESLLALTQAPPNRLVLEVTESLLMSEPTRVRSTMLKLRSQGIRFALDDFGTGYSSLGYLKRLPLDELKIDQSFIRELLTDKTDAAIVDTTILLAVSLGLTVVAEGVEKKEQFDWLKGHGCYRYQGHLFGRPTPIEYLFEAY